MSERTGIIYLYRDHTGKPIYVGQTIQSLQKRHNGHLTSKTNNLFDNHLQKHKYPFPEILEICNVCELDSRERYYIKWFNTLVPNGFNIQVGGGVSTRDLAKLSDSAKCASKFRWKPVKVVDITSGTSVIYPSIKAASNALGVSAITVGKCLQGKQYLAGQGRYIIVSVDSDIDISSYMDKHAQRAHKPIKSYNIETKQWTHYSSIQDALHYLGKSSHDGIYNCLKKRQLCVDTMMWFYEDECPDINNLLSTISAQSTFYNGRKLPNTTMKIVQKDFDGNVINSFNSINQASKETTIPRRTISYAIMHHTPTHGYIWELC